ncbi:MAG: hypothetical protein KGI69_00175 [Patescibacteria group bacterium]|nr:hypothetical protein [Patescibacteria group bacterium]
MNPFTETFFCVTRESKYRVTVPSDLKSRPIVQKWATKTASLDLREDLNVPVTGTLRHGYYLGITAIGLFQYDIPPRYPELMPFDAIPGASRGRHSQTTPLIGMFLGGDKADECFAGIDGTEGGFQPAWWNQTKVVLAAIGTEHPLVTISVGQNKFGLPRYLWCEHEPLPFTELQRSSGF